MRSIVTAALVVTLSACSSQHGNNTSDEPVMQAAGAGVTVTSEEALAAAHRAAQARAAESRTKAATATVEVK